MKLIGILIISLIMFSTNILAEELRLTLNAEQTTNGVVFSGETNLPEGTKLGIDIEKGGQDFNIFVHNEKYRSGSFTAHGKQLSGKHKVTLFTYLNKLWQNNDILTLLNNYHGDNIKNGEMWKKIEMVKYFDFKSKKESYKSWPPYKDYLQLPDSYHSPAMEKSYKDSYEAEQIVKNLPCSKGGTLDQYFSKKPKPPLDDLGWNEFPNENGVDVVRTFLLNPSESLETLEYKWHVDSAGDAKAINDEASEITSEK